MAEQDDRHVDDIASPEPELEEDIETAAMRRIVLRGIFGDSSVAPGLSTSASGATLEATDFEERYDLEARLGAGAMGTVWLARDRKLGRFVAVKLLKVELQSNPIVVQRAIAEAQAASSARHAHIVEIFDVGITRNGTIYTVMEWVDGQPLTSLVESDQGLPWPRCRRILLQLASAMQHAHRCGIIHRDLKPDNILICSRGHEPEFCKVIDFGLSKTFGTDKKLTQTGQVLGTPHYMSPEQVLGRRADERSDIYGLGVIAYELVTRTRPFEGDGVYEVLHAHVQNEIPRVPAGLDTHERSIDAFVQRALAKSPDDRFASMEDVEAALFAIPDVFPVNDDLPLPRTRSADRPVEARAVQSAEHQPVRAAISGSERRLASVVLVQAASRRGTEGTIGIDEDERWAGVARRFDADVASLPSGHILVTFRGAGAATDRARHGALCAMALRDAAGGQAVALATGGVESSERFPTGPVVDRASTLLEVSARDDAIAIDEVSEGLLGGHFVVERRGDALLLHGAAETSDEIRTVLGRPIPCVGRERELSILESMWRTCVSEQQAAVALLVGGAGMGKTRVRHELVARIRRATPEARVLLARTDSFAAGSAFRLSRQLVAAVTGVTDDAFDVAHARVLARAVAMLGETDGRHVGEFLCEMLGGSQAAPSVRLASARGDATLMREELRRAFARLLHAEALRAPLFLVLEDLHWGDAGSVEHVDELLRACEVPVFVLALARPEVREVFPSLWSTACPTSLELAGLSARAVEKIVAGALGERATADVVTKIVARADGNAFYVEELVRFAAEGGGDSPPETVLAMVHARLGQLDPSLRRVARAASVFGETAWDAGIAAALGSSTDDASRWLDALVVREILERSRTSRHPPHIEYTFRHALLQAGTYAMLTDADRTLAHLAAAEWLVSERDADARAIAEHFEVGGASEAAIPWLHRAALDAFGGADPAAALALAERAIDGGAGDDVVGELRWMQAEAHFSLWDPDGMARCATQAFDVLPRRSPAWVASVAGAFSAAAFGNASPPDRIAAALPEALGSLGGLPASERAGMIRYGFEGTLLHIGQVDQARTIAGSLSATRDENEGFVFFSDLSDFHLALYADHDLGALRRLSKSALARRLRIASYPWRMVPRMFLTIAASEIGAWADAEEQAAIAVEEGEHAAHAVWTAFFLERNAFFTGEPSDDPRVSLLAASSSPVTNLLAPGLRAMFMLRDAEPVGAAALVRGIESCGLSLPATQARVVLAEAALSTGDTREALVHAGAGLAIRSHTHTFRAQLLHARARALITLDTTLAADAIAESARWVDTLAATAQDETDRRSFLAIPPVRALLDLRDSVGPP